MNKTRKLLILAGMLAVALLLGGCSGKGFVPTSWPGVTLSESGDSLYIAHNLGIYRVSQTSGTQQLAFPAEGINGATYFSAPVFTDDGQMIAASYNNHLYSFDAANGALNWEFKARSRFIASPLLLDGVLYAPNADGNLYAISLAGELLNTFEAGDGLWATPATDGEAIFLSSMDSKVYSLAPGSLNVNWETDAGGAIVSTPVIDVESGLLYVGTFNGEVLGISLEVGRIEWRAETEAWIWGPPALVDGTLYVGDLDGNLYAFEATGTGEPVWTIQLDGQIAGAPLVTSDGLYIGTSNGNFYGIDLNGTLRFTKYFEDVLLLGTPTLVEDLILVGSDGADGVLMAFNANGVVQWEFTPEK
ncbi:MAG: hypothetical protein EPO32_02885 [Anaerolineae bacterium]|nr:MAG: hypothetical protein EPO32_02885 [Anaerolineae bacterium]